MEKQTYTCCICGKKHEGYGNNPAPFNIEEGARCCDMCNMLYVIPTRIAGFKEKYKYGK